MANEQAVTDLAGHPALLGITLSAGETKVVRMTDEGALTVADIQRNWRADFVTAGVIDPKKWVDRSVTPGNSTVTVAGGNLVITSGVGTNQERIIESVPTFSVGALYQFGIMLSGRNTNTETRVEIASVDPVTGLTDADSLASWTILGSETALFGRYEVAVGMLSGGAVQQSAAVAIPTTVTLSMLEITHTANEVEFSARPVDSAGVRSNEYFKTQNLPTVDKLYRVRIRVKNLGVAPALSTTVTLSHVAVVDYNEGMVEITGARGSASPALSLPVSIINNNAGTVAQNVYDAPVHTVESTTILGAGATFTGGIYGSTTDTLKRLRVQITHTAGNTPGHLVVEQSNSATFASGVMETARIPIPSDGFARVFEFAAVDRYVRVKFVNGATAQTAMRLVTAQERIDGTTADTMHHTLSFTDTLTALGAAATFNGTTLDLGGNTAYQKHRALVTTDQAGTLNIQQSRDGATWRTTQSQAINPAVAGTAQTFGPFEDNVVLEFQRVQFVNGATLQGVMELEEALVA